MGRRFEQHAAGSVSVSDLVSLAEQPRPRVARESPALAQGFSLNSTDTAQESKHDLDQGYVGSRISSGI